MNNTIFEDDLLINLWFVILNVKVLKRSDVQAALDKNPKKEEGPSMYKRCISTSMGSCNKTQEIDKDLQVSIDEVRSNKN